MHCAFWGQANFLGTNEWFPYQTILEGFVFVKKNEGYDADE